MYLTFNCFNLTFVTKPTGKVSCNDRNSELYYLPWAKCDGFTDCVDGADEYYDVCKIVGK